MSSKNSDILPLNPKSSFVQKERDNPAFSSANQNVRNGESTTLVKEGVIVDRKFSSILSEIHYDVDKFKSRRQLNTFGGVFAPVALGMVSTNLFLRTGFIVGQAGLLELLSMYIVAYLILFLTVLSICAISTNGAVEGGGAYYMISRALGPEFGGSIGSIFFVANVFSCALYISGFVEGVMDIFGPEGMLAHGEGLPVGSRWWEYLYATIVCVVCLLVCIFGGSIFARTVVFIFLIVVVCTLMVFVSMFAVNYELRIKLPVEQQGLNETSHNVSYGYYTGLSSETLRHNLFENYSVDYKTGLMMTYASVFAILFSSVTGIMNGANMSGELKDPGVSIPRGTLSAALFTFILFCLLSLFVAASCDRTLLLYDYLFMVDINIWRPFVVIGIFAATLSAALSNLIGASRILEALGNDSLFWNFLKPTTYTTKGGNPYIAVLVSFVLVQLVLLIGSLNAIAPLTSVFFLLSYASTNLACLALELASAPNFRPTFRFYSWHTSLLGLVGCIVMCFLISALYSSIAIIIMLLLIITLHFRSFPMSWGSISQALIFHQVRKYLLMLDSRKDHVKYWRPQMLMMVANPRQCCSALDFINDIKKGGLYILGHVKVSRYNDCKEDPSLVEQLKWLSLIDNLKIKAFAEITVADSVLDGMKHLIRLSGLGGMKPNTVCFGFYDENPPIDTLHEHLKHRRKRLFFGSIEGSSANDDMSTFFPEVRYGSDSRLNSEEFVEMIGDALKLQKNIIICRHFDTCDGINLKERIVNNPNMFVDVWIVNFFHPQTVGYIDTTCLFMLQLACILHMVPWWQARTKLRVILSFNPLTDNTLLKEKKLDEFLHRLRIPATVHLVPWDDELAQSISADVNTNVPDVSYNPHVPHNIQNMNSILQRNSSNTALTFLYLPHPPTVQSAFSHYLNEVTLLSDDLPPTVLVHGLHPVISMTL